MVSKYFGCSGLSNLTCTLPFALLCALRRAVRRLLRYPLVRATNGYVLRALFSVLLSRVDAMRSCQSGESFSNSLSVRVV